MSSSENQIDLKNILEAAFMSADGALSKSRILAMFPDDARPDKQDVDDAITQLQSDCDTRAVELRRVGNGYRYYTKDTYAPWLRKLQSTRTPRYSRALLETLSIIAYRQPVSRGDVEEIRGVAVSTDIMRSLVDREWVKQVGYRDVPGRPALYGTTKLFLEYFGLSSLKELPELMEQRELGDIAKDLNMDLPLSLVTANEQGEKSEESQYAEMESSQEATHSDNQQNEQSGDVVDFEQAAERVKAAEQEYENSTIANMQDEGTAPDKVEDSDCPTESDQHTESDVTETIELESDRDADALDQADEREPTSGNLEERERETTKSSGT